MSLPRAGECAISVKDGYPWMAQRAPDLLVTRIATRTYPLSRLLPAGWLRVSWLGRHGLALGPFGLASSPCGPGLRAPETSGSTAEPSWKVAERLWPEQLASTASATAKAPAVISTRRIRTPFSRSTTVRRDEGGRIAKTIGLVARPPPYLSTPGRAGPPSSMPAGASARLSRGDEHRPRQPVDPVDARAGDRGHRAARYAGSGERPGAQRASGADLVERAAGDEQPLHRREAGGAGDLELVGADRPGVRGEPAPVQAVLAGE